MKQIALSVTAALIASGAQAMELQHKRCVLDALDQLPKTIRVEAISSQSKDVPIGLAAATVVDRMGPSYSYFNNRFLGMLGPVSSANQPVLTPGMVVKALSERLKGAANITIGVKFAGIEGSYDFLCIYDDKGVREVYGNGMQR